MFDKEHGDCVIGVDEAGRGPLAGAVVASAVYIPQYIEEFSGINDSKKLSEKKREELYSIIVENCYVGVGEASPTSFSSLPLFNATC